MSSYWVSLIKNNKQALLATIILAIIWLLLLFLFIENNIVNIYSMSLILIFELMFCLIIIYLVFKIKEEKKMEKMRNKLGFDLPRQSA